MCSTNKVLKISTDWLALWLEFLTPDQDDMSSSPCAGQNLVRYLKVEDLWGQAFYKPFLISPRDEIKFGPVQFSRFFPSIGVRPVGMELEIPKWSCPLIFQLT
jgi:hypothetical protein